MRNRELRLEPKLVRWSARLLLGVRLGRYLLFKQRSDRRVLVQATRNPLYGRERFLRFGDAGVHVVAASGRNNVLVVCVAKAAVQLSGRRLDRHEVELTRTRNL